MGNMALKEILNIKMKSKEFYVFKFRDSLWSLEWRVKLVPFPPAEGQQKRPGRGRQWRKTEEKPTRKCSKRKAKQQQAWPYFHPFLLLLSFYLYLSITLSFSLHWFCFLRSLCKPSSSFNRNYCVPIPQY
jgi:hypothetical protein